MISLVGLIFLVISQSFDLVDSCDKTYYLHSSMEICYSRNCSTGLTSLLPLRLGQTACLIDDKEIIHQYKFANARVVRDYKGLYYACDYSMTVRTHTQCWQAGTCTDWKCTPDNLDDNGAFWPSPNSTYSYFTGCMKQGLCGAWCFLDQHERCLWSLAEITEGRCYLILGLASSTWEVDIKYIKGDASTMINLSEARPEVRQDVGMLVQASVPDFVTLNQHNLFVIEDSVGIPMQVSPIDSPTPGRVGIYQRSLDKRTSKFPFESLLSCQSSGCKVKCVLEESPIKTMSSIKRWKERKEYLSLKRVGDMVYRTTLKRNSANANMFLSGQEYKKMLVKQAACNIEVAFTQGCLGCLQESQIIFIAKNVTQEGLLFISSNCTVAPTYLRCQKEPFVINVFGGSKICSIDILDQETNVIKSSIVVNIEIAFLGDLEPVKYLSVTSRAETIAWMTGDIIGDPGFRIGLGSILGAVSLLPLLYRALSWGAPIALTYCGIKRFTQDRKK